MVRREAQTECPRHDQSQTCCNTQFLSVLAETPRTGFPFIPSWVTGLWQWGFFLVVFFFQTTLVWAAAAAQGGHPAVGIPRSLLHCRHGWAAAPGLQTIRYGLGERRQQTLLAGSSSREKPCLALGKALGCLSSVPPYTEPSPI